MIQRLELRSSSRSEMLDITRRVEEAVAQSGVADGICHLFTLHTTAGLTINEGADPAVRRDMTGFLDRLVPNLPSFIHSEGNSDAHIKSSLTGVSLAVTVERGRLVLGTWQAIYFCEFDGPRTRTVIVKVVSC